MSIWLTARRAPIFQTRAFSSGRNVARTPSSSQPVTLPPEKMRALIAMYHQADTFVTRENLMQKIDEAFAPNNDLSIEGARPTLYWRDLKEILHERDEAPKVSEWLPQMKSWGGHEMTSREARVIEALRKKAMPSLGILEDLGDMVEGSDKEDRERYEDSDY
ncbi:hypothetical protein B0H10DRAFT_1988606 [Mycena sp. CBHHK59/15]|nr:hypothetical protein B0H10DRAFT_1988606 [Mycena sp. CBHHK59/15]